eukprot:gene269-422_t
MTAARQKMLYFAHCEFRDVLSATVATCALADEVWLQAQREEERDARSKKLDRRKSRRKRGGGGGDEEAERPFDEKNGKQHGNGIDSDEREERPTRSRMDYARRLSYSPVLRRNGSREACHLVAHLVEAIVAGVDVWREGMLIATSADEDFFPGIEPYHPSCADLPRRKTDINPGARVRREELKKEGKVSESVDDRIRWFNGKKRGCRIPTDRVQSEGAGQARG